MVFWLNIKAKGNNMLQKEPETLFAIYIDGEKTNQLPSKEQGYSFDEEKSFCNNDVSIKWSYKQWTANIDFTNYKIENKERTYCNLYFQKEEYKFEYTGSEQEFNVPKDGYYQVELWGADAVDQKNGAYTSGILHLNRTEVFYLYIGEKGTNNKISGGFNGGGSTNSTGGKFGAVGGSATDIRIVNGAWNNFESLKSRIMVSAGGTYGGSAGGLEGYEYFPSDGCNAQGHKATQASGGRMPGQCYEGCQGTSGTAGGFGYGGTGGKNTNLYGGSGGGSGYYGGSGGAGICSGYSAGGGGSSFISGHNGCDAIEEKSVVNNIVHTGQPNHYSGYIFESTKMIDGAGYLWTDEKQSQEAMPNPKGGYYELGIGHTGNGYARITYLGR